MEAFYALATEDYRRLALAADWSGSCPWLVNGWSRWRRIQSKTMNIDF